MIKLIKLLKSALDPGLYYQLLSLKGVTTLSQNSLVSGAILWFANAFCQGYSRQLFQTAISATMVKRNLLHKAALVKRLCFCGAFHTNTIEGFWSLLKRGIYGVYHQVSPMHLQRYCDGFAARYNSRDIADHERFELSVKNLQGRLKYNQLIGK